MRHSDQSFIMHFLVALTDFFRLHANDNSFIVPFARSAQIMTDTLADDRPILAGEPSPFAVPAGCHALSVTEVQHYTDTLFRFRITRPQEFRFRSGEFVMIGLPNAEKPVFRAYSVASPAWDEELEFYSIKVPDGPLTRHLQKIRPGDTVLMRKKATGTLVNDALLPGRRLWMFSTGTGIAPFASLIRDPETYDKFEAIHLVHGCRTVAELKYGEDLVAALRSDPLIGEMVEGHLHHYTTVTREPFPRQGRVTDLIGSGKLFDDLGVPRMGPAEDRAMICGSMAMLKDTKELCLGHGLDEGANNKPAQFVVERAFVD
jgi:ferredoxin/flavodoxin---NADP+ reductase